MLRRHRTASRCLDGWWWAVGTPKQRTTCWFPIVPIYLIHSLSLSLWLSGWMNNKWRSLADRTCCHHDVVTLPSWAWLEQNVSEVFGSIATGLGIICQTHGPDPMSDLSMCSGKRTCVRCVVCYSYLYYHCNSPIYYSLTILLRE